MTPRVYMPGECPPVGLFQARRIDGHVEIVADFNASRTFLFSEIWVGTHKVANCPLVAPWASPTETVRDAGDERANTVAWLDAAYDEALRDGDADTASGVEWVRDEIKDGAHVGAGGKAK